MFLILGVDADNYEKKNENFSTYCSHCHNSTQWIKAKEVQKISLFFIPLIPIKTKYFRYCPICKYGEEITEEVFSI